MNAQDLPLRDIKPLLPIPDTSIYLLAALAFIGLLVLAGGGYAAWRWWRTGRRKDPRYEWLAQLERIDFTDPKRAAYLMTRYGRLLAEEKRQKEIMAQLLPRLERYKYRKEVPPLDEETKRFIHLFIEMTRDAL